MVIRLNTVCCGYSLEVPLIDFFVEKKMKKYQIEYL